MEIREKRNWISLALSAIFLAVIAIYFRDVEPFSNYPHTDEYQSLLSALGFPVYSPTLYIYFLELFTGFFSDFPSLVRFNFIASQIFLSLCFFLYHWRKKINLGTNFVMTSLLSLSTINIALTRKMHFWAAGFFFLILILADFFKESQKKIFLVFAFTILGFFRVEFFLSALAALALWIGPRLDRRSFIFIFSLGFVLIITGIAQFGYGMKELLNESFHFKTQGPLNVGFAWIKLFFSNIALHLFYSASALFFTLKIYFLTLLPATVMMLFLTKNLKENGERTKAVFKNEILPFLLPALFALLSIRFMDFYIITTFVFLMSAMGFLFDSKNKSFAAPLAIFFLLGAVFIQRPDLEESAYINFPTYRREKKVHRQMFNLISNLEMKPGIESYKILFNQYVTGVLPLEKREYFQFADLKSVCEKETEAFDIVLLPGKWATFPEQNLIETCVRPTLFPMKHIKIAPGFDLYVSSRINLEKISLK